MKVIITEKQEQLLIGMLVNEEKTYPVEPEKVLIVKKYLDDNYKPGVYSVVNANGKIENALVGGMKNPVTKKIELNKFKWQIFYDIEARFKNMFANKIQRTKFLKTVLDFWFNKKISPEGLLIGTNKY